MGWTSKSFCRKFLINLSFLYPKIKQNPQGKHYHSLEEEEYVCTVWQLAINAESFDDKNNDFLYWKIILTRKKVDFHSFSYTVILYQQKVFIYLLILRPWSSMLDMENSNVLFSLCHLELVIPKNRQFFAWYFDK